MDINEKIQKVQDLGDCSREEAIELLEKASGDPLEALSLKMGVIVKKRKLNEKQEFFAILRTDMEKLEHSIQSGYSSTKTNQSESLEQGEMRIPPEERVQQNNCYQECQIPFQE
jgi:hypothetical protein